MKRFWIQSHSHSQYPVFLGHGLQAEQLAEIFDARQPIVLMTDDIIAPLYAQHVQQLLQSIHQSVELLVMPSGEKHKTRETKAWLEDRLSEKGMQRDVILLALGGGVVLDMVGFIAATYRRGVECYYWPTTLLSMVDASVGGKTAINTPYGKNLVGAFSDPSKVIMDVGMLESIPDQAWQSGLAEVVKHAFLMNEQAVHMLLESLPLLQARDISVLSDIIAENVKFKGRVVGLDPVEVGLRACLNFGHTFAHAIEAAHEYEISHGDAVLHGMWYEVQLGLLLGHTEQGVVDLMQQCLQHFKSTLPPLTSAPQTWLPLMEQDKKNRHQGIGFVFLTQVGTLATDDIVTYVTKEVLVDKINQLTPLC